MIQTVATLIATKNSLFNQAVHGYVCWKFSCFPIHSSKINNTLNTFKYGIYTASSRFYFLNDASTKY
jgi:hypothetical protein